MQNLQGEEGLTNGGANAEGALLFYSEFDDPGEWRDVLKSELPSLDFRVYPEVGNPEDVRYVLAWKPFPGFFEPFPNLSLVVNLGAGIDSLADPEAAGERPSAHQCGLEKTWPCRRSSVAGGAGG